MYSIHVLSEIIMTVAFADAHWDSYLLFALVTQ